MRSKNFIELNLTQNTRKRLKSSIQAVTPKFDLLRFPTCDFIQARHAKQRIADEGTRA